MIWHNCSESDKQKLERLNVREGVSTTNGCPFMVMTTYPCKKTTNFGLKSTTFIGAKVWNSLPDELRSMTILKEFKNAVKELHL